MKFSNYNSNFSDSPKSRRNSMSTPRSNESQVITNRIKNIYKQSKVASQSTFPMLSELVFQILLKRNVVEHDGIDNSTKIQTNLAFQNKLIFLDLKTPETEPEGSEIAKRIAQQLKDLLASVPEQVRKPLSEMFVLLQSNASHLEIIRNILSKDSNWSSFRNYCFDNESLNVRQRKDKIDSFDVAKTYDDMWLSIGNPVHPLASYNYNDFVVELASLRKKIDEEGKGRKLVCWTLSYPEQMQQMVDFVDGIMTDRPEQVQQYLHFHSLQHDQMQFQSQSQPQTPEPLESASEHSRETPIPMECTEDDGCHRNESFKLPLTIVHRGGPEGSGFPENTLPRIAVGLSLYGAIEIDVCSAKDGLILFHDNDPASIAAFARRSGLESDHLWRISNRWLPVIPTFDRVDVYGKRVDQLTVQQVRNNYKFDKQVSESIFANFLYFLLVTAITFPIIFLKWTKFTYLVVLGRNMENVLEYVVKPPLKLLIRLLAIAFNFILLELRWKAHTGIVISKPHSHSRHGSLRKLFEIETTTQNLEITNIPTVPGAT